MKRLAQYATIAARHLRHFFSFSTSQLLWGLGVAVLLLPVAVYAWHQSGQAASVSSAEADEHGSSHVELRTEQSTPLVQPEDSKGGDTAVMHSVNNESAKNNAGTNTELHINGESIPVPSSGTVHREIVNEGGSAKVDVSVSSNAEGAAQSHSSTSINLNVHSRTQANSDNAG